MTKTVRLTRRARARPDTLGGLRRGLVRTTIVIAGLCVMLLAVQSPARAQDCPPAVKAMVPPNGTVSSCAYLPLAPANPARRTLPAADDFPLALTLFRPPHAPSAQTNAGPETRGSEVEPPAHSGNQSRFASRPSDLRTVEPVRSMPPARR